MDNALQKCDSDDKVNSPEFYENLRKEIDFDEAEMKKTLEVVPNLRDEAAELEEQTASLYHADYWHALEEMKNYVKEAKEKKNENQPNSNN